MKPACNHRQCRLQPYVSRLQPYVPQVAAQLVCAGLAGLLCRAVRRDARLQTGRLLAASCAFTLTPTLTLMLTLTLTLSRHRAPRPPRARSL